MEALKDVIILYRIGRKYNSISGTLEFIFTVYRRAAAERKEARA